MLTAVFLAVFIAEEKPVPAVGADDILPVQHTRGFQDVALRACHPQEPWMAGLVRPRICF
ncbi:MAG: hypothetical protein A2W31_12955 [Planctomycetes bacterium RBG_16_64_10]|nr:MAG: hypothetical protein A2W31_12955 [Planctomycetes bacterium RBG_16_64_10]